MVWVTPCKLGRRSNLRASMDAPKDLFDGVRPSDLRFDNVHILAEYIARAQRFADSAMRIEASAEQLVKESCEAREEGLRRFQSLLRQQRLAFQAIDADLRATAEHLAERLTSAILAVHSAGEHNLLQADKAAKGIYMNLDDRAEKLSRSANRLEKGAMKAEESRGRALDEIERLQAFRSELERFERESLSRIGEARAELYKGVGLWDRICYVLFPPVPVMRATRPPTRLPSRQ